jgi:hypothetical protein
MGLIRIAHRILVGKPKGKRSRHKWEDNIKVDLEGVGCEDVDWIIHMVQDKN